MESPLKNSHDQHKTTVAGIVWKIPWQMKLDFKLLKFLIWRSLCFGVQMYFTVIWLFSTPDFWSSSFPFVLNIFCHSLQPPPHTSTYTTFPLSCLSHIFPFPVSSLLNSWSKAAVNKVLSNGGNPIHHHNTFIWASYNWRQMTGECHWKATTKRWVISSTVETHLT